MARASETPERAVFSIVSSKYQSAPEWFDQNLPEVSEIMRRIVRSPQSSPNPFGLTNSERKFHREALCRVKHMDKLNPEHAIEGLERCAALIRDDSLPDGFEYETLVRLFKGAFGKSPGSYKTNSTIPVDSGSNGEPTYHISLVRGVVMNLDLGMRLVSITVTPRKVRERRKLMSIVGIGRDPASDVSAKHDEYLAEQSPHAAS